MKKLLTFFIVTIHISVSAQVPKIEEKGIYGDRYTSVVEEMPRNKTAPEEVYGIAYEKDGKKSFLMGDKSKKGLYDQINYVQDNSSYIVKKENLYGIVNKKAEITVKIQYVGFGAYNSMGRVFLAKRNEKYG